MNQATPPPLPPAPPAVYFTPLPWSQEKLDQDHLKTLSTFHYVGAGLSLLGLLGLIGHYWVMSSVFGALSQVADPKHGAFPFAMFDYVKWVYPVFGAIILISGVLNLISASAIKARKHRTFSLVVAGLNCLHMPLGTILGIFTIMVLMRDSVREIYQSQNPVER
ncbi:MAG: hypothetical protein JWP97_6841 [Labilithrix sp.]|nr:hypothetical protein [Labilithrix sp.]